MLPHVERVLQGREKSGFAPGFGRTHRLCKIHGRVRQCVAGALEGKHFPVRRVRLEGKVFVGTVAVVGSLGRDNDVEKTTHGPPQSVIQR